LRDILPAVGGGGEDIRQRAVMVQRGRGMKKLPAGSYRETI